VGSTVRRTNLRSGDTKRHGQGEVPA